MAEEFVGKSVFVQTVLVHLEFVEKFPTQKEYVELKLPMKEYVAKFLTKTAYANMLLVIVQSHMLVQDMSLVHLENLFLEITLR